MDKQEKQEAKKVVAELMQAGYSWQEATQRAGISMGKSTAYSVWKKYRDGWSERREARASLQGDGSGLTADEGGMSAGCLYK